MALMTWNCLFRTYLVLMANALHSCTPTKNTTSQYQQCFFIPFTRKCSNIIVKCIINSFFSLSFNFSNRSFNRFTFFLFFHSFVHSLDRLCRHVRVPDSTYGNVHFKKHEWKKCYVGTCTKYVYKREILQKSNRTIMDYVVVNS